MVKQASGQAKTDASLFEAPLSEQEKALRDLFVNEYLKDFDPFQAALRVGFLVTFALEQGKKLMQESYVQRQIALLTRKPSEDFDSDKALIENTLRQAMQHGPYASRVSAAKTLAEMRGLAKPDTADDNEAVLVDLFRDFATKVPV